MKDCRKRQVERRGDEVSHRCVNKKADAYRTSVDASICDVCPVRVAMQQAKQKQVSGKNLSELPVIEIGDYPSCEFRVGKPEGKYCGVTNLPVNPEICTRCVKDDKTATATFGQKAVNYLTAVRRWVAAGRPERTDEEIQEIYDNHCSGCSMFDKERQVCNSCGCPASKNQPALRNKLRMATEECPLGRFPAKVKTHA